jgi:hypothetical protein
VDTLMIILVLGLVLLAIVALPKMFRGKDDADSLPLPAQTPTAQRSPKLATVLDIDSSPLARWLCDEACAQTGIDLRADPIALTRIAEAAKKAQWDIDKSGAAEVSLPYISADTSGPKHFELRFTREQVGALKQQQL